MKDLRGLSGLQSLMVIKGLKGILGSKGSLGCQEVSRNKYTNSHSVWRQTNKQTDSNATPSPLVRETRTHPKMQADKIKKHGRD